MATASAFAQWLTLSRDGAPLSGPREIINGAQKQSYTIFRMINGREKEIMRWGAKIVEKLKVGGISQTREYVPGSTRQINRVDTSGTLQWDYSPIETAIEWTEDEIEAHGPDQDQKTAWKNFKFSLEQDGITDQVNFLESRLWGRPDYTSMEGSISSTNPRRIYSIPTYCCERTGTSNLPPGWTGNNIANGQVDNWEEWRNNVRTYDHTNPFVGNSNLFRAFSGMMLDMQWDGIPGFEQYSTRADLQRLMIYTNTNGRVIYEDGLKSANDHTRAGPQDPSYGKPVYLGIPIDRAPQLDSAPLNEVSGSYDSTNPYPDGQPRFFFINANFVYPVFFGKYLLKPSEVMTGGINQRDVEAMFWTTKAQLICKSRRKGLGLIRPASPTAA